MKLTGYDRNVIGSMRNEGVLIDFRVRGKKNQQDNEEMFLLDPNGLIIVPCGDGDQSFDILTHLHREYESRDCPDSCLHVLSRNGGSLKLVQQSPAFKPGRSLFRDLFEEVIETHRIKRLKSLGIFTHAPCGIAVTNDLDFVEQMRVLFAAKRKFEKEFGRLKLDISVVALCHIMYDIRHRRTYASRESKFNQWLDDHARMLGS